MSEQTMLDIPQDASLQVQLDGPLHASALNRVHVLCAGTPANLQAAAAPTQTAA